MPKQVLNGRVPWSRIQRIAIEELVREGISRNWATFLVKKRDGPAIGGGVATEDLGIPELIFGDEGRVVPKRLRIRLDNSAAGDKFRYKSKDYIVGIILRDRKVRWGWEPKGKTHTLQIIYVSLLPAERIDMDK